MPILTRKRKTVMKNLGIRIPEKRMSAKRETHRRKHVKAGITRKAKDEENSKQVGRSTIGCQLHDAKQHHAATVFIGGHADSSGQEQCPERGIESDPCSPSA
ncbi:hypothetical protein ACSBR1_020606 [Camellia fascicularis]